MIGRLTGKLLEKQPPMVLIEANGVGYEVDTPMSTYFNLPDLGATVSLHIHMIVREDAHLLYGFATDDERKVFRILIKLTGVGPKVALAILSGMSVTELAGCVADQDGARLTRIPGIGKKTAERLLLELKGKLDELPVVAAGGGKPSSGKAHPDVIGALVALGYSEKDASAAAAKVDVALPVSEAIRQSLKLLSRG